MYFLAINGQQTGPFSLEQLQAMAARGQLAPADLLWKEGMSEWAPASNIGGIFDARPAAPMPSAPRVGPPLPSSAQFTPAPMTGRQIPNYLWQSIVLTVCFCPALGIPAIIFSTQVNSKQAVGDIAGAQESSRKTRMFCWLALGIGLAVWFIALAIQIVAIVVGSAQ